MYALAYSALKILYTLLHTLKMPQICYDPPEFL